MRDHLNNSMYTAGEHEPPMVINQQGEDVTSIRRILGTAPIRPITTAIGKRGHPAGQQLGQPKGFSNPMSSWRDSENSMKLFGDSDPYTQGAPQLIERGMLCKSAENGRAATKSKIATASNTIGHFMLSFNSANAPRTGDQSTKFAINNVVKKSGKSFNGFAKNANNSRATHSG